MSRQTGHNQFIITPILDIQVGTVWIPMINTNKCESKNIWTDIYRTRQFKENGISLVSRQQFYHYSNTIHPSEGGIYTLVTYEQMCIYPYVSRTQNIYLCLDEKNWKPQFFFHHSNTGHPSEDPMDTLVTHIAMWHNRCMNQPKCIEIHMGYRQIFETFFDKLTDPTRTYYHPTNIGYPSEGPYGYLRDNGPIGYAPNWIQWNRIENIIDLIYPLRGHGDRMSSWNATHFSRRPLRKVIVQRSYEDKFSDIPSTKTPKGLMGQ